jgi:hypothetical protein
MSLPKPSKSAGKLPFIKWEEGQNRIRIISEPEERYTHFIQDESKSVECQGRDCVYCQSEVKRSHDYYFLAIDRQEQLDNKNPDGTPADPSVKLCRFAPGLYGEYFDISQNPDWEFDSVPGFDMVVTRNGKGLNTKYTLTPCPAKALSERDTAAINASKSIKEMVAELFPKSDSQASWQISVSDLPF